MRAMVVFVAVAACGAREKVEMHDLIRSDGELRTAGEVRFRVRPLAGEGSTGPHELAPESAAVLEQVRAVLEGHPDARLRIECTVSSMLMSASPDPAWGATLANQVAAWLVQRGVDCHRLDPVGFLGTDPGGPPEQVRFFIPGRGPDRPDGARADACAGAR
jgi:hypothetical protein